MSVRLSFDKYKNTLEYRNKSGLKSDNYLQIRRLAPTQTL